MFCIYTEGHSYVVIIEHLLNNEMENICNWDLKAVSGLQQTALSMLLTSRSFRFRDKEEWQKNNPLNISFSIKSKCGEMKNNMKVRRMVMMSLTSGHIQENKMWTNTALVFSVLEKWYNSVMSKDNFNFWKISEFISIILPDRVRLWEKISRTYIIKHCLRSF